MQKIFWSHKKYQGTFVGSYERVKGERIFVLTRHKGLPENGKLKNVRKVYESHEAAKKLGWY